ncbi:MAG: hypothetical protein IJQ62_05460 [Clostridia bacterium]|nr:hypothetical protein [Clostridia bacterium]
MSRKRRLKPDTPAHDPLFDIQQAASVTECTGILPAQPETLEERRSIARLGAIHPPEDD